MPLTWKRQEVQNILNKISTLIEPPLIVFDIKVITLSVGCIQTVNFALEFKIYH